MAKIKMNIQFEEDMKNYIETQSEKLGVSQAGFINLCVAQYKQQNESIIAFSNMHELISKIDDLQNEIKKNKKECE